MTKVIDYILLIGIFGQKCVVIKGMFQSLRLKDQVQTIGIDQSLSNNSLHEHKFLENIKNVYKQARECYDQKQFKDIPESAMVSTTEGFTDDSPISPMTSTSVKKPRARKPLCLFTNILDVK